MPFTCATCGQEHEDLPHSGSAAPWSKVETGAAGSALAALAFVCVALAFAACARDPTPDRADGGTEYAASLAAADRTAYEATIARLEAENRELDRQLFELRSEKDLAPSATPPGSPADSRLEKCEADLARYKAGLERAVEELNANQAGARLDALSRAASATKRPGGPIASRLGPRVQVVGSQILVTGELWSYRDVSTEVKLHLELVEDGRVVDQATLDLTVPANTDQTYSHTFYYAPVDGATYSARARMDY